MGLSSPPYGEPIAVMEDRIEQQRKKFPKLICGHQWFKWLSELVSNVDSAPKRLPGVSLSNQQASIALTTIAIAPSTGAYRVTISTRPQVAATTSSKVQVTINWSDGSVTQTWDDWANTGNTTTSHHSSTRLIRADRGTSISYTVTYASVGAGAMQYQLDIAVEVVPIT